MNMERNRVTFLVGSYSMWITKIFRVYGLCSRKTKNYYNSLPPVSGH